MGKFIDLTGQRFGRLTAIKYAGVGQGKKSLWLCKCDCGEIRTVQANHLRSGHTVSCGCYNIDKANNQWTHFASKTRLYRIWADMLQRCQNPNNPSFAYYGGRGITICPEWLHDFGAFQEWAYANGYREYLTIDRIDNDKGYSPDNCRWVTMAVQNTNKRPRHSIPDHSEDHIEKGS